MIYILLLKNNSELSRQNTKICTCFKQVTYSSVPNRRIGPNKRAGVKILKKNIKRADPNKPCRGDFFLKINKRAGQIPL